MQADLRADSALRCRIRWMIRRDMPEVMQIEAELFEVPWQEADFIRHLRQRNCIGMVAAVDVPRRERIAGPPDECVVGFMVYALEKTRILLLNFAVTEAYRRRGVGSQMIAKLAAKLSPRRRRAIVCEVRESNVLAQIFFRSQGFRARKILRGFYRDEDTDEDAYRFVYRVGESQ